MNYFIHDTRDLSPAYVKSCEKFLNNLKLKKNKKKKAASHKLQAASLTACPRNDRMKFYCNVKLNYLLQRLTSFRCFSGR